MIVLQKIASRITYGDYLTTYGGKLRAHFAYYFSSAFLIKLSSLFNLTSVDNSVSPQWLKIPNRAFYALLGWGLRPPKEESYDFATQRGALPPQCQQLSDL